jgi:hypothetical protein
LHSTPTTSSIRSLTSGLLGHSGLQRQNTGTTATINQSAAFTSGSATLVLHDANGVQVYNRSLADNGTFSSDAGTAGTWTVRVIYNTADATVNFRLDKASVARMLGLGAAVGGVALFGFGLGGFLVGLRPGWGRIGRLSDRRRRSTLLGFASLPV